MTSDQNHVFVWVFLPGDTSPTLCGKFSHESTAANKSVGHFVYGKSYLENPDRIALDPITLPLKNTVFSTTFLNGVFGALQDAMPDDWGRYVIEKTRGAQKAPIGIMLNTLSDSIGNIVFSAASSIEPNTFIKALPFEKLEQARSFILKLESEKPDFQHDIEIIQANTAMGGARPKMTIDYDGELWIAKFPSSKDSADNPVAKIESAMLDLAELCGIDVPKHKVVLNDVFLVQRFDRRSFGENQWARDSFLSARTIFHSSSSSSSYSGSYPKLANELQRYSANPQEDKKQLFRRMVFNVLIGNTDDHDRNHGLLADDEPGTYRLSPAYDLVAQKHNTRRRFHAMELCNGSSLATRENLLADCGSFGLSLENANEIIESITDVISKNWQELLKAQGLSENSIQQIGENFNYLPENEDEIEEEILRARGQIP